MFNYRHHLQSAHVYHSCANPMRMSMVTGVGYNQPVPHSRFFGPTPGGFNAGPRGDAADQAFVDQAGRLEWSSTEYWLLPIANALSALAWLMPAGSTEQRRLGRRDAGTIVAMSRERRGRCGRCR